MPATVTDKLTPEGEQLEKQLKELATLECHVGFQHGVATDEKSGADMADIAMWNEVGNARIPARPFIRQSVDNYEAQIETMCKAQLSAVASGKSTAETALNAIGTMQKGLVQETIRNGGFTPNKPSTIKRKKSAQPLIDQGSMRQSVMYTIQPKGE